jgi:hypothetical protein
MQFCQDEVGHQEIAVVFLSVLGLACTQFGETPVKTGQHFAEQGRYFFLQYAIDCLCDELEKTDLSLAHHIPHTEVVLFAAVGLVAEKALFVVYLGGGAATLHGGLFLLLSEEAFELVLPRWFLLVVVREGSAGLPFGLELVADAECGWSYAF